VIDLLTLPKAAKRLRVDKVHLYTLVRRNAIPHVTIGGVPHVDIQTLKDWLRKTPDTELQRLYDRIGLNSRQLADWTGVHIRTIQRWRIHGMPAHGKHTDLRTRKSEFLSWARKHQHVWEQINLPESKGK
jgi:hypothetical protein